MCAPQKLEVDERVARRKEAQCSNLLNIIESGLRDRAQLTER